MSYGFKVRMNLNKVSVAQAKLLQRNCVASWYMRHKDFERELQIPRIGDDLNSHALKYAKPL